MRFQIILFWYRCFSNRSTLDWVLKRLRIMIVSIWTEVEKVSPGPYVPYVALTQRFMINLHRIYRSKPSFHLSKVSPKNVFLFFKQVIKKQYRWECQSKLPLRLENKKSFEDLMIKFDGAVILKTLNDLIGLNHSDHLLREIILRVSEEYLSLVQSCFSSWKCKICFSSFTVTPFWFD